MATIKGTDGNDTLKGTAGDDILQPFYGTDTVDGGAGIDTLVYDYPNTLFGTPLRVESTNASGTSGTFTAGTLKTTFSNIESFKIVSGGTIHVDGRLAFGPGTLTITGTGTDAVLDLNMGLGTPSSGVVVTINGRDATIAHGIFTNFATYTIGLTNLADTANGGEGGDGFNGQGGDDKLYGNGGSDGLSGQDGADLLDGGAGDDRLVGGGQGDHLLGGDGNDLLIAAYSAQANDDKGHDVLDGGAGDDQLFGDAGDTLIGGAGRDTLGLDLSLMKSGINLNLAAAFTGGSVTFASGIYGSTTISSVENYNYLILTDFADVLQVGATARFKDASDIGDAVFTGISAGGGDDKIYGSNQADRVYGGAGNDRIYGNGGNDQLQGEAGNDILVGGYGNDTLSGWGENDQLFGGAGADALNGGDGNDMLRGGAGIDQLDGGDGRDTFVFAPGEYGTTRATADTIFAFQPQQLDQIDLSLIDANTKVAGNQAFTFIGSAAFSMAGQLRVTSEGSGFSKVTWVEGDTNGDGVADMVIKLGPMTGTLPLPDLSATHFIL